MNLQIVNNNNTKDYLHKGGQVGSYAWSVAFPPDSSGAISKILIMADYCRESLIANIFSHINYKGKTDVLKALVGKNGESYLVFVYRYEDDDDKYNYFGHKKDSKPKNISGHRKILRLKLEAATKVLNVVERKAKWPITRLITPTHSWSGDTEIAVFKADSNWFYSPYMFSLLIMILRSALYTNVYRLDKVPNLKNMAKRFVSKKAGYCWSESRDTKDYAHDTIKYWVPTLKNFKMLHRGTDVLSNFTASSYKFGMINIHKEGIGLLVDGESNHPVIAKRFEKIRESVEKG